MVLTPLVSRFASASLPVGLTVLRRPESFARTRFQPIAAATPPERRTRLGRTLITIPREIDRYFQGNVWRQAAWCFVSTGAGFYSANTATLTFGTLAINDVLAAVVTLVFVEVVSYIYWTAPRVTLRLNLINSFKNGVIAALIADALKLGS